MIPDIDGKMKGFVQEIRSTFRDKVSAAMLTAFGFLIALYWKDIIIEIVKEDIIKGMGLQGEGFIVRFVSLLVVTGIAVLGIYVVSRWAEKEKEKD